MSIVSKEKIFTTNENGDVVAKYKNTYETQDDLIERNNDGFLILFCGLANKYYNIENRFNRNLNHYEARAVCSDDDTYDEHKGIQIASTKSDWKFHDNIAKRYKAYRRILEKMIDRLDKLIDFHEKKCNRIQSYIERM